MVLVDTSVWIDHFRRAEPLLQELLGSEQVTIHPFIIGELACGNLKNRELVMDLLRALPCTKMASHEEVLYFIGVKALHGKGLGWIDAHLLASVFLSHTPIWTRDRRLAAVAKNLDIAEKK